jgi:hypothetical protein
MGHSVEPLPEQGSVQLSATKPGIQALALQSAQRLVQ